MDRYCKLLSRGEWNEMFIKFMGDSPYPGEEMLVEMSNVREKIWMENHTKILSALIKILGFEFTEKEIIVYTVGFGKAHSDPLVVPSNFDDYSFINVLIHELIHRVLTRNSLNLNEDILAPLLYPKENQSVAIHITVHALLKYIYLDVLNDPQRLEEDILNSTEDYRRAWDIVESEGYLNCIKKIEVPLLRNPQ